MQIRRRMYDTGSNGAVSIARATLQRTTVGRDLYTGVCSSSIRRLYSELMGLLSENQHSRDAAARYTGAHPIEATEMSTGVCSDQQNQYQGARI
jgi:hypothetical protein